MSISNLKETSLAAGAVAVTAGTAGAAKKKAVDELIANIKDTQTEDRATSAKRHEALLEAIRIMKQE